MGASRAGRISDSGEEEEAEDHTMRSMSNKEEEVSRKRKYDR